MIISRDECAVKYEGFDDGFEEDDFLNDGIVLIVLIVLIVELAVAHSVGL